ncbi:MAG: hypothetical protein ACHQU0_00350 [Candidatus Paceibacteria bacterium]
MSEGRPIVRTIIGERMESSYLKIDEAHKRAKEVLGEYEIKPETFEGFYDKEMLKRDAAEVERLEEIFNLEKNPSKIYGDILEAVMCEHGELSDWFGPDSQVMKTASFDDYINKIDMVVETESKDRRFSHLALGIDVTFGSRDLSKKFNGIRAKIDNKTLGEIKYFHSDRQNFSGRLTKIPQVVVGVELERAKEVALLWMNRKNKELAVHPIQVVVLEEAALQLKTFADYSRKSGRSETAVLLEAELRKIEELLAMKKAAGIQSLPNDKVFEEIRRNLSLFR